MHPAAKVISLETVKVPPPLTVKFTESLVPKEEFPSISFSVFSA